MSDAEKLKRLAQVSHLMMDARMLALEKAARARQNSLDRLAELDLPVECVDLSPLRAAEVAMRYALWADQRRSEINTVLAGQTVAWVEARQEAARAFGRNQIVQKLATKGKVT